VVSADPASCSAMTKVRRASTAALGADEIRAIREILWSAFVEDGEGFTEDDWQHALGGVHVIGEADGAIVAHASVVERPLEVAGRPLRTGYVEAVATAPAEHGRGHGSAVMSEVNAVVRAGFELGALGTGRFSFYERLGWERWRGPSYVRTPEGERATPDDDGALMVLRTPATPTEPPLDLATRISCDWRSGDVW
jgi:aminoglycoside 2'-N-acetyltransferase I